jgi:hypothetical protein
MRSPHLLSMWCRRWQNDECKVSPQGNHCYFNWHGHHGLNQRLVRKRVNMKESIFIIAMGIVLWIIAFVFAVVMNADSNVLWICVIGALLGVIGLRYTIRRGRKGKL